MTDLHADNLVFEMLLKTIPAHQLLFTYYNVSMETCEYAYSKRLLKIEKKDTLYHIKKKKN